MASMSYCVCQNVRADLETILNFIQDGKSFSDDEQRALKNCLDLAVSIMDNLGLDVNFDSDLSISEAVDEYCLEVENG